VTGIVLKPGTTVELTPPSVSYLPDRTYLLRVPTSFEAVEFEERVELDGARQRFPLDIAKTFRAELVKLVASAGDAAADAPILAKVDAWVARIEEAAREVGKANTPDSATAFFEAARLPDDFLDLEQELFQHSRTWRAVQVGQRTYRRRYGLTAAQMFLADWRAADGDGDDLPEFRRDRDGVPDELLRLIHPDHLEAIGGRVTELIRPSADRLGNSPSASSGTSSEKASTIPSSKKPRLNGHSSSTTGSSRTSDGPSSESTPALS
jgi:hypothetical protein